MSRAAAILALALATLPGAARGASADPCAEAAAKAVKQAEKRPMLRRATVLLPALAKDEALGCGLVPTAHWSSPPKLPPTCELARIELCAFPGGVETAPQLARDADPEVYARVQLAAQRLASAGKLSAAHLRLFETVLLSSALQGEATAQRR